MKQYLKFKWKQIIPKPDPTYGLPLPRSSHGVSILRNDVTKTTKLLVYGGEHMARTPMDKNEAASVWICDLTQVKSMLSSPSTTPKTSSIPTSKNEKEEDEDKDEEEEEEEEVVAKTEEDDAMWKRINCLSRNIRSRNRNDNVSYRHTQQEASVIPPSRIAHAQAVYKNRYVYIFGGRSGVVNMDEQQQPMNDLWVLDTMTNSSNNQKNDKVNVNNKNDNDDHNYTWSPVEVDIERSDALPEPRSDHRMLCMADALYVFGGYSTSGRLNDLYKFDIPQRTWHNLGSSTKIRGRDGMNMIPMSNQTQIAMVGGYTGQQQMSDGHMYDISKEKWDRVSLLRQLDGVRPRSVCVNASFTKNGIAVIFGGQVNPADRGHVGAGSFCDDIVVLDEQLGFHVATIPSPQEKIHEKKMSSHQMTKPTYKWHDRDYVDDINVEKFQQPWPKERGWADADYYEDVDSGVGYMYLFGGLSGTDAEPIRLNDLWKLEVCHY